MEENEEKSDDSADYNGGIALPDISEDRCRICAYRH